MLLEGMRPQRWKDAHGIVHEWFIDSTDALLLRRTRCRVYLGTPEELKPLWGTVHQVVINPSVNLYRDEPTTCFECLTEIP